MIEINNKVECSGCCACSNVCPQNCINMKYDNEGFLYPIVDTKRCINCNMCMDACPILQPVHMKYFSKAYAAFNQDLNVRLASSSGGIFLLIAEAVIDSGGIVFGARFDSHWVVVHDFAKTKEDVKKFIGSKYVQSNIGNSYKKVEDYLKEGKIVLFTGTPCQIGGLKKYIGREYKNLLTQDIICHGVPSLKVWKKYVTFREAFAGANAKWITFRAKIEGWKLYSTLFLFENGVVYRENLTKDLFMRGFLQNLYLRPSCYDCRFKTISRCSDFTLADFWGVEKILPEFNDNNGVSLVIVHSVKGQEVFELLKEKIIYREVNLEKSIISNPSIKKSVGMNYLRKSFFCDIDKMSFDNIIEKYCGTSIISRVRRKLSKFFK